MTAVLWCGGAPAVQQVTTIMVSGRPAAGQLYAVTVGGQTVKYVASDRDSNASIAASLQSRLAGCSPRNLRTWNGDSTSL